MTSSSPLSYDPERPLGLMLSGGGARGAFQVGVWKTLLEDPRGVGHIPDVISGTSAGALNGALLAAGLSPDDMMSFWYDLADDPPVEANAQFFQGIRSALTHLLRREPTRALKKRSREFNILRGLFGKHRWYQPSGILSMLTEFLLTARFDNVSTILESIQTTHLFGTAKLRDRLAKVIGEGGLKQTHAKLAINTVNIATGRVVRIVNHPPRKRADASAKHYHYTPTISLDMIIASTAIPLLFNPVKALGMEMWDGGLLVNSPMAPAIALGAERLIPVLVTVKAPEERNPLTNFGSVVERLVDIFLENAYNIDRKLLLDRNMFAKKLGDSDFRDVNLYQAIRPANRAIFDAGSYLYFEREAMASMFEAGRLAARRWLSRGPLLDHSGLESDSEEATSRVQRT